MKSRFTLPEIENDPGRSRHAEGARLQHRHVHRCGRIITGIDDILRPVEEEVHTEGQEELGSGRGPLVCIHCTLAKALDGAVQMAEQNGWAAAPGSATKRPSSTG